MISKKECEAFQDLVKLVRETTWIESGLGYMGGDGAGIWEKFDSIRSKFPRGMEQRLINIATIRNNAVHGNPAIANINKVLEECASLTKIIQNRRILDKLLQEITEIYNELKQASINTNELNKEAQKWLNKVASQKKYCESCETDAIAQLSSEKEGVFRSIHTYVNEKNRLSKIYNELKKELEVLKESGQSLHDFNEDFQKWESGFDAQYKTCTTKEIENLLKQGPKHLSSLKRHLFPFKIKQYIIKSIRSHYVLLLMVLTGLFYIWTLYGR